MTLVKKIYNAIPFITVPIATRRQRLLKDPVVIELILGAFVAAQQGERPEVYIKSLMR